MNICICTLGDTVSDQKTLSIEDSKSCCLNSFLEKLNNLSLLIGLWKYHTFKSLDKLYLDTDHCIVAWCTMRYLVGDNCIGNVVLVTHPNYSIREFLFNDHTVYNKFLDTIRYTQVSERYREIGLNPQRVINDLKKYKKEICNIDL